MPYRDYTDLSTEELNNPDYGIAGEEREPGEEADDKKNQLQPQQSTNRQGTNSRLEDPKSEDETDIESAAKAESTELDSGGGSGPEDGSGGGDGDAPAVPASPPIDGGGFAASKGAAQGLGQLNKANQAMGSAASKQPKLESSKGESDASVEQQKQAKERRRVAKITSRFQTITPIKPMNSTVWLKICPTTFKTRLQVHKSKSTMWPRVRFLR